MELWIELILAAGGFAGLAQFINALVGWIRARHAGVSAREEERHAEIVRQRDEAMDRAERHARATDVYRERAEVAHRNEQRAMEYAADLRLFVIDKLGIRRGEIPNWPKMENDPMIPDDLDITAEVDRGLDGGYNHPQLPA